MRAAAIAEKTGVTAVAIASTGFLIQAGAIGRALGITHVPVVEYPGTIPMDSDATIRRKAREVLAAGVIAGLSGDGDADVTGADEREPDARDVVFRGDFDAVQDH